MTAFTITVNGKPQTVEVDGGTPLLWVLRDSIGLTGTKYSCGRGLCGSCTVHVDGEAVRSCITPIEQVGDQKVTTIEGLSPDGSHPLQQAWVSENVPQCGYCQIGQIMAAAALLSHNPNPTDEDIDTEMYGNACRCGTYSRIRQAIKAAAKEVAR